ncbi:MAG: SDR family NAD(P)-dependent oxidoreductase, partial [Verrucomicrobia bacterium]|nr:SDR family NAD(P)-dependent oxidoreductase [Verrucomicrobiota bacterium]
MSAKILLTGGAGYIGSHTAVELLEAGYEVLCVDNCYNSSPDALKRVEKITGKTVKFYQDDILDADAIRRIFSENKIDAVIHFAGLKAVGESVSVPLRYYHNNISGTVV